MFLVASAFARWVSFLSLDQQKGSDKLLISNYVHNNELDLTKLIFVYIYVCVCVCVYVFLYVCVHMHTYIDIYVF